MNINMNSELRIKNVLDFIEEVVGHSWMENWVHSMRDNFGRLPQNVSPLAVSWLKAKDELAAYQLTDKLILSESTVRLLQLGDDLKLLKEHKDLHYQIQLLKGTVDQFSATCYRMYIASNYHRQNINFIFSSPEDLTLFDGNEEVPVVTMAPVLESASTLINKVHFIIKNAVNKLPSSTGKIYIDFPLSPSFAAKQIAKEIKKQIELMHLTDNISLIITLSYVENKPVPKVKYSMFSLKQSAQRMLI